MSRPIDDLFDALERSPFRRRFRLSAKDRGYLEAKGLEAIMAHAAGFVGQRLAPAAPRQDGRQTPMRGHPVFTAQHATATCCRKCLARWHGIAVGRSLSESETAHVLSAIARWLEREIA